MPALLDRLARDHRRLKRLLFVLRAELDRFGSDANPDFDRISTILEYVDDYGNEHHHPAEERAFALLDTDALDPTARNALERVQAQHQELPELTRKLRQDLDAVIQGMVIPRSKLEDDANTYLALHVEHLALEDDILFPLLAAELSAEQLAEFDDAGQTPQDPLFDYRSAARFERLYFDILEAEHGEHED